MLFYSGKNKDAVVIGDYIIFAFSDRLSAFDSVIGKVEGRGKLLASCTRTVFSYLGRNGIRTAMIGGEDKYVLMEKCEPIPFELIMRNALTGSALKRAEEGRLKLPKNMKCLEYELFPEPLIELSTKKEVTDRYDLSDEEIVLIMQEYFPKLGEAESMRLVKCSIGLAKDVAGLLTRLFHDACLFMIDGKVEFGVKNGLVYLIDSFGPDEFRVVSRDSVQKFSCGGNEFYDKEFIRRELKNEGKSTSQVLEEHGRTHVGAYALVSILLREASERLCQQTS